MPEAVLLLAGLLAAGAIVLAPLRTRPAPMEDDPAEAAAVGHRVALEALRDVELDRRAGSLDDAAYARELAVAEARAAATRTALDEAGHTPSAATPSAGGRRLATLIAAGVATAIVLGAVVPASGIANGTVVNQALADAEAAEAGRQARITELLADLGRDPRDPETLSALADAYLAGSTRDDLVRAAAALQVLIQLEPERADAYERIITAYLRGGDAANARAAWDAYAALDSADPVEVAFFDGLIALRGEADEVRAIEAFDRFLELASDDPRTEMVRGLRDEAESGS